MDTREGRPYKVGELNGTYYIEINKLFCANCTKIYRLDFMGLRIF